MYHLVLNQPLKHGHAQIVLSVKLMHRGARPELFVISDQNHMLCLGGEGCHDVSFKDLGCLLDDHYREDHFRQHFRILSSPGGCHGYDVLSCKERSGDRGFILQLYPMLFLVLLNAFVKEVYPIVVQRGHHVIIQLPSLFQTQISLIKDVYVILKDVQQLQKLRLIDFVLASHRNALVDALGSMEPIVDQFSIEYVGENI